MNSVEISLEYSLDTFAVRAYDLEGPRCQPDGDLPTRAELQLPEDTLDVSFDGALADNEALADLAIGESLRDEGGDLSLPRGQRSCRRARDRLRRRGPFQREAACRRPPLELSQVPG